MTDGAARERRVARRQPDDRRWLPAILTVAAILVVLACILIGFPWLWIGHLPG